MNDFFADEKSAIVTSDRVLYTPSAFARDSLLHLQEIGRLTAKKPHVSARDALESYLFILVEKGEGNLTYEGKTYPLNAGSCVFIDCRRAYSHATSKNHPWTLCWCHFDGPTLSRIYEKYRERGGRTVFEPENLQGFRASWEALFALAKGTDYVRDMKINEGLGSLLTLLMEESWHPEEAEEMASKQRLVVSVKAYLDDNYPRKITLDELSAKFFINK